jgi:hypothetical protein
VNFSISVNLVILIPFFISIKFSIYE